MVTDQKGGQRCKAEKSQLRVRAPHETVYLALGLWAARGHMQDLQSVIDYTDLKWPGRPRVVRCILIHSLWTSAHLDQRQRTQWHFHKPGRQEAVGHSGERYLREEPFVIPIVSGVTRPINQEMQTDLTRPERNAGSQVCWPPVTMWYFYKF